MNKREVDQFLEPLKNRPDLNPRTEYKQELRNKLSGRQVENNKRKLAHWVPNLVAAALLIVGVVVGAELITSDNSTERVTPGEDLQPAVIDTDITDISEEEARELIGTAFAQYSIVVNGGGPEIGESFKQDGMEYRFMGEDFLTEETVLSYLKEKYTEDSATKIVEEIPFIVKDEKLAQPNKFITGNLQWADGEIQQLREDGKKTRLVKYKVPVENMDRYQSFNLILQYENGWKLDGKLPFSYGDNTETTAKADPPVKEFTLTDTEEAVYEKFASDFDEEHLRGLEPISIAKLYVFAELENNQDVVYALYTDKEGYVQWTKEEHLEMSGTEEHSKEKTLEVFNGLQDGNFIEKEENRGYIEFYNANGMVGFQVVKDEDGIWNVSYMPIQ
ncbi:DL-endopeptidase inhibitor IseA family protein [Bacillus salacetis]|uniref:DL-endopeptidase inhibitor IseA family protein n=1 Tax=Bacillus salacetis TaxID=2315464 RepID=UPI003B9E7302